MCPDLETALLQLGPRIHKSTQLHIAGSQKSIDHIPYDKRCAGSCDRSLFPASTDIQ